MKTDKENKDRILSQEGPFSPRLTAIHEENRKAVAELIRKRKEEIAKAFGISVADLDGE